MALFDFPDPNASSEQRIVTVGPMQRLFFMNSPFVAAQAKVLGERLARIGIAAGYELIYGRPATAEEIRLGEEFADLLPPDSPALHVVQRVRDEAHRFAITGHRRSRAKARQGSVLDDVAGLGPARRRALLKQFGGLKGVQLAGLEDLAAVQGIGPHLAQVIYDHLHTGN